MQAVNDMKDRIDQLAELMDEFKLSEAELAADGFRVTFKKRSKAQPQVVVTQGHVGDVSLEEEFAHEPATAAPVDNKPTGTPITSPMTGIYYSAPSPSSPPYLQEGDAVSAGQVIGLIEAMKVFNEIPAPTSGVVVKVIVESGQLVNLGDPLMYLA
jgi:acetyl-CoA carboxylase biotin carboxyl carrier protein